MQPISRALSRPAALQLLLAVALAVLASSCASAGKPIAKLADEINATLEPTPGRFLPGDRLSVRFANDPTKDQTVRVDLNGNVSLLLVGVVHVAGKRPEQVQLELEEAYRPKLTSPDLAVNLLQFGDEVDTQSNRSIHICGEVRFPRQIRCYGQQITLMDAMAEAGGHLKATALLKDVLLVRYMPEPATWRAWHIDARPENWESSKQILLQPNDLVYIPNKPIDDVDIWMDQYIRQLIPFPYLIPPTLLFPSTAPN